MDSRIKALRDLYESVSHNLTARNRWSAWLERDGAAVLFRAIEDADQTAESWRELADQMGKRLEEAVSDAAREREALLADTEAVRQAAAKEREQAQREIVAMSNDLRTKEEKIKALTEQVTTLLTPAPIATEMAAPKVQEPDQPRAWSLFSHRKK